MSAHPLDAPTTQAPSLPPDLTEPGGLAPLAPRRPSWLVGSTPGLAGRLRLLVLLALAGCIGLFVLTRSLASQPALDASWRANAHGQLELASSPDPSLAPFVGHTLLGVIGGDTRIAVLDALALQRSPRWLLNDGERAHHREMHERLAAALTQPQVRLYFADGGIADLDPTPRGVPGLGLLYALIMALALGLYLLGIVVLLARPSLRNVLYGAMALAQSGNLAFIAAATAFDLTLPPGYVAWELPLRTALDLLTGAAIVHAACIHPRRLPKATPIALIAWSAAALLLVLIARDAMSGAWWWTQSLLITDGLMAIALLSWSYRIEPHPFALLLRRLGLVAVGTLMLLTLAIATANRQTGLQQDIAWVGSMIWSIFLASLLLLVPFLSRSQHLLREFSLLAGLSTVATSLDLLFVAYFSLSQFTSITLSVFVSLGLYATVRQWLLNQVRADNMASTERLFERLYRMAREVERHPDRASASLRTLLGELFDPLETHVAPQPCGPAHSSSDGSTLSVPVPDLKNQGPRADETLTLRFAQRGRRLFNREDARLADRVVEQLKRAVQFDQAVEHGRREERSRIAQDLHDDIGARLLTMMYQAQSPEHEDYIRHTLQDLKTLTRGLAAPSHTLADASGEWKADLQHRLGLAHIAFDWHTRIDRDVDLTVVQWSALTRVLRELVSNAIAHSQATRVAVSLRLVEDRLEIVIRDDGMGRNPQAWAHGLGLGGVRKRVRQLGGEVHWIEAAEGGIECHVTVGGLSQDSTN